MLLAGKINGAVQLMLAKLILTQQMFITELFQNLKWCMVQTQVFSTQQIYTPLVILKVHSLQEVMVVI